jgi:UDP-N-acetylglucosamine 2-epimerase (non-hydrolysing)
MVISSKTLLGRMKREAGFPLKVMMVAGARPNFMKLASIVDAIRESNVGGAQPIELSIVHTGQHYDTNMSEAFIRDLNLPIPHVQLGVGSGSHAHQTAEIMKRFEPVLLQYLPDVLLVVGDVNSTLACALVGTKITYAGERSRRRIVRTRPVVGHVEAGLRSGDRSMPEEINRLVTDSLSDLLFVTEPNATKNLRREGIPSHRIFYVGNTMVDTLLKHYDRAQQSSIIDRLKLFPDIRIPEGKNPKKRTWPFQKNYGVVTLHRPSNVDQKPTFTGIMVALRRISRHLPLLFPVHPRTVGKLKAFGLDKSVSLDFFSNNLPIRPQPRIVLLPPLGYLDCLGLISRSKVVLTDSGGMQEETTALGIPCVTIRENTERPITITCGTNILAGTMPRYIEQATLAQLEKPGVGGRPPLWDGKAGKRIVKVLLKIHEQQMK